MVLRGRRARDLRRTSRRLEQAEARRAAEGRGSEEARGSAKGGGARLTALGTAVLQHYRALQDRLQGTSDCEDYKALASAMLPEPKASQKA